jgi:hypothetical protein
MVEGDMARLGRRVVVMGLRWRRVLLISGFVFVNVSGRFVPMCFVYPILSLGVQGKGRGEKVKEKSRKT